MNIELTQEQIEQILLSHVEEKNPEQTRDKHPEVYFDIVAGKGLVAEISFTSYN